jgi:hypothetical protein
VGQIAAVKDLLDQNAITQDELEKLKANALLASGRRVRMTRPAETMNR